MKPSSQLTGVAGEYFVAAELSRRGFIASITMRNSPGIDILATDMRGITRGQAATCWAARLDSEISAVFSHTLDPGAA